MKYCEYLSIIYEKFNYLFYMMDFNILYEIFDYYVLWVHIRLFILGIFDYLF